MSVKFLIEYRKKRGASCRQIANRVSMDVPELRTGHNEADTKNHASSLTQKEKLEKAQSALCAQAQEKLKHP